VDQTTFDLTQASTSTLTLLNSNGSNVANLNLSDGELLTNGTSRLTNAGALQNITGYSQASGNFAISGAGSFATGTGPVTLNGDTHISNGHLSLTGFAQGGVLYTDASASVAATFGSANQVLHGGTTPTFGAVDLTADVTGILPIATAVHHLIPTMAVSLNEIPAKTSCSAAFQPQVHDLDS